MLVGDSFRAMEERMRELLVEQLIVLRARLSAERVEALLTDPDAHSTRIDRACCRAVGWIEGVADAAGMTMLELVDWMGIEDSEVGTGRDARQHRDPDRHPQG